MGYWKQAILLLFPIFMNYKLPIAFQKTMVGGENSTLPSLRYNFLLFGKLCFTAIHLVGRATLKFENVKLTYNYHKKHKREKKKM